MLLIDPPQSPGHGRLWSHLASDTSYDELHAFAASLGIPRRGFDRDHYDIPAQRYDAVVAAGARPVASRELVATLRAAGLRRRRGETPGPRRPGRPLLRPPRLAVGDRVAVVAPAGPVPEDRLAAGIAVLESWGLEVSVAEHVRGADDRLGYLAADDAARTADLQAAWCDPEVRAVLCARGGYGAQRVLERLDWAALAEARPKPLVGFSDITALHQAFAARLGVSTVHGPSVTSLAGGDEESRQHLRRLLLEPTPGMALTTGPVATLVPGRAEGVLVGGNLALLAAGVGAPLLHPARSSVVVLEDVHEPAYRIDRMLTQLLRSGWFEDVRGIALGEFTDGVTPAALLDLALERLGPLGVPMIGGLPVGHGRRNLAVPLGVRAALDADAGSLVVLDAPLS